MNKLKVICITIAMFTAVSLNAQKTEKWSNVTIQTNGTCQACKDKIEKNLAFEKGVKDVNYDLATAKVKVTYDPKKTTDDNLRAAIVKLGYTADAPTNQPKSCNQPCNGGGKASIKPVGGSENNHDHNHDHNCNGHKH